MKKVNLLLAAVIFLAACSKQETAAPVTVKDIAGTYQGDAWLRGPSSCIKGEGGEKIRVSAVSNKEIAIWYLSQDGLPGFVPFPSVQATLISFINGVYYFKLTPVTTAGYKVWPEECKTEQNIKYNIAIWQTGEIDAHMGYYDFKIPQGDQYFDFTGVKIVQ
jgi:hypothetical protein